MLGEKIEKKFRETLVSVQKSTQKSLMGKAKNWIVKSLLCDTMKLPPSSSFKKQSRRSILTCRVTVSNIHQNKNNSSNDTYLCAVQSSHEVNQMLIWKSKQSKCFRTLYYSRVSSKIPGGGGKRNPRVWFSKPGAHVEVGASWDSITKTSLEYDTTAIFVTISY